MITHLWVVYSTALTLPTYHCIMYVCCKCSVETGATVRTQLLYTHCHTEIALIAVYADTGLFWRWFPTYPTGRYSHCGFNSTVTTMDIRFYIHDIVVKVENVRMESEAWQGGMVTHISTSLTFLTRLTFTNIYSEYIRKYCTADGATLGLHG